MMSKDRVRFTVPARRLYSVNAQTERILKLREILRHVFNLDKTEFDGENDLVIVCRPSQFARFIIMRDDAGLDNGIKELNASLFTPTPERGPIDVSARPNRL